MTPREVQLAGAVIDWIGVDMPKGTCIVEGCEGKQHVNAGWCNKHYYRVKKNGSPDALQRLPRKGMVCVIDGCQRDRYSGRDGWCALHYQRYLRQGDPLKVVIEMPQDGSFSNSAAHKRVEAARGPAKTHSCEFCGEPALHWSYDHADPEQIFDHRGYAYSGKPEHYRPLCVPCHKRFDMDRIKSQRD